MKQQADIIDAIAKHLGVTPQDIEPNASLRDDLGLGPIEISDLLNDLATQFNIIFDPTEIEQINTVDDLIVAIEDLLLD